MPADNERIAVVEKAIEGIERGVSRLESKIDSLIDNIEKKFVTRHEYDTTVDGLKEEIKEMKSRNNKIVGGILTAILTLAAALIQTMHLFK